MKLKLHKPVPFRIHHDLSHRNNDMPQFQVVILSYCTAYADLGAGAPGKFHVGCWAGWARASSFSLDVSTLASIRQDQLPS